MFAGAGFLQADAQPRAAVESVADRAMWAPGGAMGIIGPLPGDDPKGTSDAPRTVSGARFVVGSLAEKIVPGMGTRFCRDIDEHAPSTWDFIVRGDSESAASATYAGMLAKGSVGHLPSDEAKTVLSRMASISSAAATRFRVQKEIDERNRGAPPAPSDAAAVSDRPIPGQSERKRGLPGTSDGVSAARSSAAHKETESTPPAANAVGNERQRGLPGTSDGVSAARSSAAKKETESSPPAADAAAVVAAKNVMIGTSLLAGAGRGVFARLDMPKDAWTCDYHGYRKPAGRALTTSEMAYLLGDDATGCVGYMVPQKDRPDGVAQLMNDGARPIWLGFPEDAPLAVRVQCICEAANAYWMASTKAENVANFDVTDMLAFKTLRAVKSGEELYYSYGFEFWLRQAYYDPKFSDAFAQAAVSFAGAHAMARHRIATGLAGDPAVALKMQTMAKRSPEKMRAIEGMILMGIHLRLEEMLASLPACSLENVRLARAAAQFPIVRFSSE